MKRFFSLISVFLLIFAVACGGGKKEKPAYEEQVTKEISAEEGGKVESSDGNTSIEIPGGALDENTNITMTIYDAKGYVGTEGQQVLSKVVEFEPSGLIFKKPVVITMINNENAEGKIITAAVYRESKGEWSYNEHGVYAVVVGKDEAGDPIMQSAAGDPIMLNAAGDPIMTNAAGDPIMMAAAGDPIMLAAAGDPIMTNAAGDPIMNSAAGDPIMMTTGHFTAYLFLALEPTPVEEPDGDDVEISDKDIIDEPVVKDDDEDIEEDDDEPVIDEDETPVDEDTDTYVAECGNGILDPDEACDKGTDNGKTDCAYGQESCTVCTTECTTAAGTVTGFCGDGIVQSNEKCDKAETGAGVGSNCSDDCKKLYSKAVCTGLRTCASSNGSGTWSGGDMPVRSVRSAGSDDSDSFSCPKQGKDFFGQDVQYAIRKSCVPQDFERVAKAETDDTPYQQIKDNNTGLTWLYTGNSGTFADMSAFCSGLDYAGKTWRLPTPKEFMTIVDSDARETPVFRKLYFKEAFYSEGSSNFWTSVNNLYFFNDGSIMTLDSEEGSNNVMCVSGEEYGKASASNYTSETVGGEEALRDSSTNLLWQKSYVSDKTWKEALEYCEKLTYAGYSDWRLPNKNELVSLLDYSKTDIFSSFPGMTANVFASSTKTKDGIWSVSMKEGRIDYVLSDNDPGEEVAEVEEGEEGDDSDGSSGTVFSVRCVRSDLDDLPEDGIPLCNEKIGYAPCRDELTNKVWSSKIQISGNDYEGRNRDGISWSDAAKACLRMNSDGSSQWRIPTIDELRTLMKDDKLKTGGACGVKSGCLTDSCHDEVACTIDGETAFESRLRDYGILVSGDAVDNDDHTYESAWAIHTPNGALSEFYSGSDIVVRCVLDETLPDVNFPYTQNLEGGDYLVWSSMPDYDFEWADAAAYCAELEEGGSNNWRVPTIDELVKILKVEVCEEACAPNSKGENSIFGDLDVLWSSSVSENEETPFNLVDFMFAKVNMLDPDVSARVRCVRAKGEPETVAETGYYEDENTGLVWSEPSESMATYDYETVEAYCNGLNDAAYSDVTDWRVPTVEELSTLLANCEASPSDTGSDSGRMCSNYSFKGYSVLGDMLTLISSTLSDYTYDAVNFASGEIRSSYYLYGNVRCVSGGEALPVLPGE